MGEGGLKRMDDFGSFGGIQVTNSGRTLSVFYQHTPLSLGVLGELTIRSVGRTIKKEITRIENVRHANQNLNSVTL